MTAPVVILFVALFVAGWLIVRSWQACDDMPREPMAHCCGQPLSEWFIARGANGWGMRCFHCDRVYPFTTHAEYRETMERRK